MILFIRVGDCEVDGSTLADALGREAEELFDPFPILPLSASPPSEARFTAAGIVTVATPSPPERISVVPPTSYEPPRVMAEFPEPVVPKRIVPVGADVMDAPSENE